MNDASVALSFAALGHPIRVAILRLLVQAGPDGLSTTHMRDHLKIPATTFGHHLKAMADARLVTQSRQSRTLLSRANYPALQSLIAFLMEDCCRGQISLDTSSELETS